MEVLWSAVGDNHSIEAAVTGECAFIHLAELTALDS
jgi:hypothetical protein